MIRRYAEEGEMYPPGYGLAWREWSTPRAVCYPIGLNIVARWIHDFYLDLTTPKALRDDVWSEGEHYAAFRRGVEAGRAFERRWPSRCCEKCGWCSR
jgi:hypothetical protein